MPPRLTLYAHQSLVFYAFVPALAADLVTALQRRLSRSEQQRAARFSFDRDRELFVAAHALARRVADHVEGKDLRFSLSHCAGLAACAVAAGVAIGVDVEGVEDRPDLLAVAHACFGDRECTDLAALPRAALAGDFARLWTLKEAIVKASGIDLSRGLREFCFTLDPLALIKAPAEHSLTEWQLAEFIPGPGWRASFALLRPLFSDLAISWHEIAIAALA